MRNPFKRQIHHMEKPTLQERAATLKISMAHLIRGRQRVDLTDQPSSASLPQGSVEDPSATTFIDPHRTRHDVGRGDPNRSGCTAATDGHAPRQESAMGRHESFDPNTAVPMLQSALNFVPIDTGPARAEAGIAAMLAEASTSEASEAPLPIEPGLAQACLAQAERLKRWDENPGSLTEEEANAEMVRWGIIFRRAVEEPSAGLIDLTAKARLMQDDMDRFLPADRYGTDNYRLMRVILREVVALAPSEVPAAAPADLPPSDAAPMAGDPVLLHVAEAHAALDRTLVIYAEHRGQHPDADLPGEYHRSFDAARSALFDRALTVAPTTDTGRQALARLALDFSQKLEFDFEPEEANAILAAIAGGASALPLPEPLGGGMAALLRDLEECNRRYLALPLTDEAEAEGDVLHGQHWNLSKQIDALPATSLAGFRLKARAGLLALKLDTRAENEAPGSFISLAQQVMRGLSAEPSEGSVARRDLSLEAFNYAYGLDLTNVPFENLWRLYEAFSCVYDALSASEDNAMFRLNRPGQFRVSTAGGIILAAEINRMGCLRDAMALQLQARTPADEAERDARLKVLVAQEMNCEGTIHDKALLAEVVAAWGAK